MAKRTRRKSCPSNRTLATIRNFHGKNYRCCGSGSGKRARPVCRVVREETMSQKGARMARGIPSWQRDWSRSLPFSRSIDGLKRRRRRSRR